MMFEWILVGVIWAAAIVLVAHTIDEVMRSAAPLRAQLHRCPDCPGHEEQLASRVHRGTDDEERKWAA